jgi:hypothetical protein
MKIKVKFKLKKLKLKKKTYKYKIIFIDLIKKKKKCFLFRILNLMQTKYEYSQKILIKTLIKPAHKLFYDHFSCQFSQYGLTIFFVLSCIVVLKGGFILNFLGACESRNMRMKRNKRRKTPPQIDHSKNSHSPIFCMT